MLIKRILKHLENDLIIIMNTKHLSLQFNLFGLRGVAEFKNKLDLVSLCYHIYEFGYVDSDVDAAVERLLLHVVNIFGWHTVIIPFYFMGIILA